ncbi:MAG: pimeloyl-[acyl-carrier protein] methyl ester esterase [Colwelliaceae bacterium]|nr:pimeloyl-[acyl-carrier protein] methyl ester esterase [Colwelliaceae bacterium]
MAQSLHISSIGEGIPIVLLHGWGLNSAVFTPLAEALSSDYQVLSVDLPGYGYSRNNVPSPYDLAQIADLVAEGVEQHSEKPAIYLGWSMGGLIATHIALHHSPEKVLGLVTVASTPCFAQRENWPGIKRVLLDGFHQQIATDIEKTLNGFLKIQAMGSPHIKEDIKNIQRLVMSAPLPDKEALIGGLGLLNEIDLRSALSDITSPFLRVYGKMDGLVPKAIIERVSELSPESTSIVFDKASHAPFISDFEDFTSALQSWLKGNINT